VTHATVKIDFAAGLDPTQKQVDELTELVQHLLNLPAFGDKKPSTVLNALISAYWTAAHMAGMEAQAAEGMVQFGGRYLAGLALARQAAACSEKPVVH
jgi:hypothetical protein